MSRHLWLAAALFAMSDPGPAPAPEEEDDRLRFRRTPTNPSGGYYNDHTGCTTGHRDPASPRIVAAARKRAMRAAKRLGVTP